jgi:3-oxoacyl-[acyl-carrier protein] reductase
MDRSVRLDGRVAVVTGGSRGIGLAVSRALLSLGGRVVINGLSDENLNEARQWLIEAAGVDPDLAVCFKADVRDYEQVQTLFDRTVERLGGVDILVNNAGVGTFGEVAEQSLESWNHTIGTNLTGVFHCCRAAVPYMRRRGGGWIINISSLAAKNPFAGAAAYCASKAGMNAFTEALMQEVRYDDIRVTSLLPGSVRTEFGGSHAGVGTEWKLAPEDVAQAVVDIIAHDPRSLPSRVELRPSKPRK